MAIGRAFIHTATIKRPAAGTVDVLNQPTAGTPTTVYTALAGRLIERRERLVRDTWAASVLVTTYTYLTAPNADVRERDLVTSITLEDGTILTKTFVVKEVLRRVAGTSAHHKALALEVVS